jgi:hypothetical protein
MVADVCRMLMRGLWGGSMNESSESRRRFLKAAGLSAGAVFLPSGNVVAESGLSTHSNDSPAASESGSPEYTLHIKTSPIEIAPNRIISATTYNGQFPGPLLRFKEGQQVTRGNWNLTLAIVLRDETVLRLVPHRHGTAGQADLIPRAVHHFLFSHSRHQEECKPQFLLLVTDGEERLQFLPLVYLGSSST